MKIGYENDGLDYFFYGLFWLCVIYVLANLGAALWRVF